ncbi:head-tail adaptor protein [Phaeobacter sp. B1627]|uniref:head-tail adaptor protein n=1 Tax=Phaeobacter sp. B1627 TaxID=2583809 RepID=UPI00111AB54F|nr:head-tail adaptor protein [Phaeobacter sp. B1627]TNJ39250.1 head-tail adaptor protein [Phaeobacter sp. B1627]
MRPVTSPTLDRLVQILAPQVETNPLGETLRTGWAVLTRAWAQVTPVSDGERLRAAAVEQKTDARFVLRALRYMAQVDGTYGLRFDGADWQITGVKPLGRTYVEITAWRLKARGLRDGGQDAH